MIIDGITLPNGTQLTPTELESVDNGAGLGVNQTWQDMTASRTINTTYTNNTGKPIIVKVTGSGVNEVDIWIQVDSATIEHNRSIDTLGNTLYQTVSAIVPNGSAYSVTINNASLSTWYELA